MGMDVCAFGYCVPTPSLQHVSDAVAGFGDFFTLGGTAYARSWINGEFGLPNSVDYCSGWYSGGEYAGFGTALFLGGYGILGATADAGDVLATPEVENAKLQNIVDDLYRGTTNPDRVGNGTTADAIRNELETGQPTGGRFHFQKGLDYARALENFLSRNPDASYHDRLVAQSLLDDLRSALGGR